MPLGERKGGRANTLQFLLVFFLAKSFTSADSGMHSVGMPKCSVYYYQYPELNSVIKYYDMKTTCMLL